MDAYGVEIININDKPLVWVVVEINHWPNLNCISESTVEFLKFFY